MESYIPQTQAQKSAKAEAEKYARQYGKKATNLLFIGPYGTGKSHLAKAAMDKVIERGFGAIFISVPKLLSKLRSSYAKNAESSEEELLAALNTVDLLILDDLGAESQNDWASDKLFQIVDSRQGMSTIYTSNDTPAQLMEKMGERNFSRVANDDTTIIEVDGPNYRLRKFTAQGE
jgi:DNA replication protein DnaC